MFIELEKVKSGTVLVNLNNVVSIRPHSEFPNQAVIHLLNGSTTYITVEQSYDQIKNLIAGHYQPTITK